MNRTCSYLLVLLLAGCFNTPAAYVKPHYHTQIGVRAAPATAAGVVAVPPACPPWRDGMLDAFTNQPIAPLGCANAHNLAVQAADPRHLMRGAAPDTADGDQAAAGVGRYRADKVKELPTVKVEEE